MEKSAVVAHAKAAVVALNGALHGNDEQHLASCFYEQAYWRDIVALTSHLRTIDGPLVVSSALLKMIGLRGLAGEVTMTGEPHFAVMGLFMVSAHEQGEGIVLR